LDGKYVQMIERALRGLDLADLHILDSGKRLVVRFAEPIENGRERDLTLEDVRVLRAIQQSDESEPYPSAIGRADGQLQ